MFDLKEESYQNLPHKLYCIDIQFKIQKETPRFLKGQSTQVQKITAFSTGFFYMKTSLTQINNKHAQFFNNLYYFTLHCTNL